MPIGSVKSPADERDWEEAKREAQATKPDDFYALAMHIFQAKKKAKTNVKKSGDDENGHEDQLPGGRADKKAPADFDVDALAEGTKHELEHTKNEKLAREIAMDHLAEDSRYYVKLRSIEVEKAANPITREDASPQDVSPNDQLDRGADTERRVRPRFVIGSKPSPIGKSDTQEPTSKAEHTDNRRKQNAQPHNRAARRAYMKTEEGRRANRTAQENYRNAHPERVQAQHEARSEHGESKGSGHKCATCGKPAMHKHHANGYGDGDGARIRWLCHEHHVKAHHPKSDLGEKSMRPSFYINTKTRNKLFAAFGIDPLRKGQLEEQPQDGLQITKSFTKKLGIEVSSRSGEKKEKSMSVSVFEQIMKGAILDGVGVVAERMGAVELKREIAKAEMSYAESMMRAANAEAFIADLKKGLPPWLKDKKKDGDGGKDAEDDKDDEDGKDEAKKAGLPRGYGTSARQTGASKRGVDDEVGEMNEDAEKSEKSEKSLETIGREGGEAALEKAMQEAFARATEARNRIRELSKALSTIEHGEAGQSGAAAIGASQTSAALGGTQGAGDTSNAEPFGSLNSMNGMPSVDASQSVLLSDDDRESAAQMSDGQGALERTMTHGSSGLNTSVGEVMGGDISAGSGMAKGTLGRMGALGGGAQQMMSAANAQHAVSLGYGVPPPAPAPTDRSRGREFAQGMVHYSTSEDVRVADLMSKSSTGGAVGQGGSVYGGATGEPTLDLRAPLLKSMTCALCKSSVPAMFARCPACGNDHATGSTASHGSTALSKSVKDSLRGPVDAPVVLPNGVLAID
jgi:hypothetical protein